jgi:hypothetical protein
VKLLGQENCTLAGGTREIESVGEAASAAHAMANTQKETHEGFMPG